jgi:hypothetical protein
MSSVCRGAAGDEVVFISSLFFSGGPGLAAGKNKNPPKIPAGFRKN